MHLPTPMSRLSLSFLDRYREYGPLFIRLVVGFHLVYKSQDNVFSSARMHEFVVFLEAHGFPLPAFCAPLSVYAQFVCGLLFIVGAFARHAGAVMTFNFVVAYTMVHWGLPYPNNFEPLMMLAAGLFFLFHGAGRLSVDEWLARRARAGAVPA